MFLAFLRWLFRISGHAPSKKSDKVFAAAAFCLLLVTARPSVLLSGRKEIDFVMSATLRFQISCFIFGSFCNLINANVREFNFELILDTAASSYDIQWKEIFGIMVLYTIGCCQRLVPFLRGEQTIWLTLKKIYNFHSFYVPLVQLVLLCRVFQNHFRSLNNQLKLATSDINSDPLYCSQLSLIFKNHNDLRMKIRNINTYFSVFNLFFLSFIVTVLIGNFYIALKALQNGEFSSSIIPYGRVSTVIAVFVGLIFFCDQVASEANKTVSLAHNLLMPHSSPDLMHLVEMFSLSHVNNPVSISVAGVFDLNMALLTKVVGFSLAYFVVILQLAIT